jgi:F-type H+-transporting ATPase subunit alpha
MAELTIRPEEIRDALDKFVSSFNPDAASRDEVGTVVTSGDGIAHVEGLPSAMANELLQFANGTLGIALNLDVREIGVVVLGNSEGIEEGSVVKRTGEVLSVPVGDGYLGRVVDAMGNPIDGLGDIAGLSERRELELQAAGAMEYTTIVHAPASDPAGFKYIAPYTGSAIGQHWMYAGKHVLIVFDDLTKQAEAYRSMSLLLRRPPGREAYPGDVFYLHSRLLERCAKLSDDLGGGSMTGLPIIETKANDVSAYIPTNVISITDGQIFLQSDLFNANQRPAIDVGISVSRVGGDAQIKAMKKVSGTLKIGLAQYRDMQAFAMFASDLDAASRRQLDRGQRLVELLRQPQYRPFPVADQVISVWAGTNGYLDDVPVADVLRFEAELLDYLKHSTDLVSSIATTGQWDDDTAAAVGRAIDDFKLTFTKGDGHPLVQGDAPAEAIAAADLENEQIVVSKRR